MAGSNNLEVEIFNLFQEKASLDYVCSELLVKYLKAEIISPSEIDGLCHFFITSGRFDYLKQFLIVILQKTNIDYFPLGFFIWAHEKLGLDLNSFLIELSTQIIESVKKEDLDLYQSSTQVESLIKSQIILYKLSHELNKQIKFHHLKMKTDLIDQLHFHNTQEDTHLELKTLDQLKTYFPLDEDIEKLSKSFEIKKTELLLTKSDFNFKIFKQEFNHIEDQVADPDLKQIKSNIQSIIQNTAAHNVEQLYNLSIMCFQAELYDECLQTLNLISPFTLEVEWLKAEVLFLSKRFYELFNFIQSMKFIDLANQEHILAINYYKANALFAINRKQDALHLLESILKIRTDYRSTLALLAEWKKND